MQPNPLPDRLTADDPHYWAPFTDVVSYIAELIAPGARVLEIGPGQTPFPRATDFVDIRKLDGLPGPLNVCDLARHPLPYDTGAFDFVYCRHVLEDMAHPFLLCDEMQRVGKAGYIETPSPLAEFCRGVDGGSPNWRGYHHHRFMVWNEPQDGLCFVSKFPIIEYTNSPDEGAMVAALRNGAYWNTYFLWENGFQVRHIQCPFDFMITENYPEIITHAIRQSIASTDQFVTRIAKRETPWPSTS